MQCGDRGRLRGEALELIQGQYDSAISRLQSLAPAASGSPFWQLEMGQLLMAAGQTDLAYQHLANAEQQLAELRKTPARVQLSHELHALLTQRSAN